MPDGGEQGREFRHRQDGRQVSSWDTAVPSPVQCQWVCTDEADGSSEAQDFSKVPGTSVIRNACGAKPCFFVK